MTITTFHQSKPKLPDRGKQLQQSLLLGSSKGGCPLECAQRLVIEIFQWFVQRSKIQGQRRS
uniref:Uncharacterized protein n=1 Tax=Nelumbo nucifera TaxID=4432 RepID=A0A822YEB2_NELNU|nr:TPA_asm: hypothetical protein HUJ06_011365 [Nelumbo nucifera]